jgi:hypothetical protein
MIPGAIVLGLVVIVGLVKPNNPSTPTTVSASAPPMPYTTVVSYRAMDADWSIVHANTRVWSEITALGIYLHKSNPEMRWHITDNPSQAREYAAWAAGADANPRPPYPRAWVTKHALAIVNPVLNSGRFRWAVHDPSGANPTFFME